ncbi:murein tripeptide amidase MpaA [Winogradskyella wandonensis]|uniref:Murein tripeptide amidase MpaA n=1 Tax=Winogradskyella wandonensis TaxID=1442586 RepID=A0A4R1KX77_9FLAO|nr:M14 metallopeptidase family protein [Winogradskyella wandonensis]TCK69220.1 murein tripeptide amidase MpaA [Winogradskyella wandonensis]
MEPSRLTELHKIHKENSLLGRYITLEKIEPLVKKMGSVFEVTTIGLSVNDKPIYTIKVGHGKSKILLWSQMHGNESTTTKALFDLLNWFLTVDSEVKALLEQCTLLILPMLNPDGAENYTRVNANIVDLNRDAQNLTQPESIVLRKCFDTFMPDYCFNLHGQRTIFGAGNTGNSATLSFLSPAQNIERTVTFTRKKAMAIISFIYKALQAELPMSIGRYDDGFNLNCVGDTFQSLGAPTVLYEAGHYKNDYDREVTRLYAFKALYFGIKAISDGINPAAHKDYFSIPENEKNFYDIIIRDVRVSKNDEIPVDIAIQFKEVLENKSINFVPIVEKIGRLNNYYAHKEIFGNGELVLNEKNQPLEITNEIVFVMLNNRKILIKS